MGNLKWGLALTILPKIEIAAVFGYWATLSGGLQIPTLQVKLNGGNGLVRPPHQPEYGVVPTKKKGQ